MNGELIVEAGSTARKQWEGPAHNYAALHEELIRTGVLVEQGDHRVFVVDYAFSSPSAAAAIVAGRAANGLTSWETEGGRTYKEWEADRLLIG